MNRPSDHAPPAIPRQSHEPPAPPPTPAPEAPRPAIDAPYGVGVSQPDGAYVDTAGRGKGPDPGAYQDVRPWGPQEGVDDDAAADAGGLLADGLSEQRRAGSDQGLGPDIAPPTDLGGHATLPDERLKQALRERLRGEQVHGGDVTVDVTGGHVTLSGEVDSNQTRLRLEALLAGCDGVLEIDNRLRIAGAD